MVSAFRQWSQSAWDAVRADPARLRLIAEVVLALLLAVQLAWLVWILFAPRAEPVAPAAANRAAATAATADMSVFQRFDPFFRSGQAGAMAGATGAEASQMRLYGVRSDGRGGGSAIIGLGDGRQVSVGVGQEVEPGLILESAAADHVILNRGGSRTRLEFGEIPAGAPQPPPPPAEAQTITPNGGGAAPASAEAALVDPARLVGQAGLRPRMQGLRMNGLTVSASGDGSALRAAGLQSGDVILAVNGQSLDNPARIAGLRGQLAGAPSAEIRFERDGVEQTITIRTAR